MTKPQVSQVDANEKLKEIRAAQEWLESLGLTVRNSRYTHAMNTLERGIQDGEVLGDDMIEFQWALEELEEFVEIHKLLGASADTRLIDSLAKSLKGALTSAQETAGPSAAGRNYTFELYVAARLKKLGFDVSFEGLADVVVHLTAGKLFIECKRAMGKNSSNLLKEAFRQIRTRCENSDGQQFGIVALCLTPESVRTNLTEGPKLENLSNKTRAERERAESLSFANLKPYCPPGLGIITVKATPFWNEEEMLISHRRMDMRPMVPGDHPFLREMRALWRA